MDVIPGKSTIVKFGHEFEKIFKTIGISLMTFLEPQTLSVTASMVLRTSEKSVNLFFVPFSITSSNSA